MGAVGGQPEFLDSISWHGKIELLPTARIFCLHTYNAIQPVYTLRARITK